MKHLMKVRIHYLFHSGFLLETDGCILVFDYWMDPSNTLCKVFKRSSGKMVYVFASHFHEDHFNREIFGWKVQYPSLGFIYILSKDIVKHRRATKEEAHAWLAKGALWSDGHVQVTATGSNDSGVSWTIEVSGMKIFHAGDLCNWYARFLSDNRNEAFSTEFQMKVNPVAEEKRYLGELKDIRKCFDAFDIVMFPVDSRIGNGYTLGARQFIERFKVSLFVPMHFAASGPESTWRMEPFCQEQNIAFWKIKQEGDCLEFTKL